MQLNPWIASYISDLCSQPMNTVDKGSKNFDKSRIVAKQFCAGVKIVAKQSTTMSSGVTQRFHDDDDDDVFGDITALTI